MYLLHQAHYYFKVSGQGDIIVINRLLAKLSPLWLFGACLEDNKKVNPLMLKVPIVVL